MSMKSVLKKEIELISLSREEILKLSKVAKEFISSLRTEGLNAFIGGSLAKGTVIKGEGLFPSVDSSGEPQDVDIFVVFDYSEDIKNLEKVLKKIHLPGILKKVHGSRDYFQISCDAPKGVPPAQMASADADEVGNVLLEVIPVVKNKDPELAENVTDVSLSHVKYIGGEIKKNPKIADDIRLAKAFCRANRCYGAEGYARGFSGYSLEVLVIYFGGFVKFLKGIQKKRVVDPLKYFKSEREILSELNASKLNCPVVLIDPTYKYRNISAGLGFESFESFINTAKKFLKSPSLEYFEGKGIDIEGMKKFATKKKAKFVEVNLKTDRQDGDIAGTKMKKLLDFFAKELVRKQQKVLRKEFDYLGGKKAKGYLVVEEKMEIEVKGPSVGLEEAVKNFKKAKGRKIFKSKNYYWFKEKSGVAEVFKLIDKVGKEMGAEMEIEF
ncbi:MAG: hypothetical protein ABIF18_02450 [archaeon]